MKDTVTVGIKTFISEWEERVLIVQGFDGPWGPDEAEKLGKMLIEQADVCRRMRVSVVPKADFPGDVCVCSPDQRETMQMAKEVAAKVAQAAKDGTITVLSNMPSAEEYRARREAELDRQTRVFEMLRAAEHNRNNKCGFDECKVCREVSE